MPEELKDLLDRIQKDGVEKAEAEASRIIEKAKADAAAIREKARADSAAAAENAAAQAASFEERARKTLNQAARDLMLSIHEALQSTLDAIVAREVAGALDSRALGEVLRTLIADYFSRQTGGAEIIVPETMRKEVAEFLLARFRDELARGIEIKGDRNMAAGFRVSELNGSVVHDLSAEAIAESLSRLLRPHLADIVRQALKEPAGAVSGPVSK